MGLADIMITRGHHKGAFIEDEGYAFEYEYDEDDNPIEQLPIDYDGVPKLGGVCIVGAAALAYGMSEYDLWQNNDCAEWVFDCLPKAVQDACVRTIAELRRE